MCDVNYSMPATNEAYEILVYSTDEVAGTWKACFGEDCEGGGGGYSADHL